MIPKIKSLKADIIERNVDISFLQEIWEQSDSDNFKMKLKQCLSLMVSNTYLNQDQKMEKKYMLKLMFLYLKTWMCFGASSGQKNNRSNLRRL